MLGAPRARPGWLPGPHVLCRPGCHGRKYQEQFLQAGCGAQQDWCSERRQSPRADHAWCRDTWGRKGQGRGPRLGCRRAEATAHPSWCLVVAQEYVKGPELGRNARGAVTPRAGSLSGGKRGLSLTICSLKKGFPTMSAAPWRQQEAPQRQGEGASLAQPGN